MPRVKVDYVVSFSSEDPDNPASNLLATEVNKKKWLCGKAGEPLCSVVLQLVKAVTISAIQIVAHHAAMVEVLVGLSEKPNDPFKVLVPSSVFLTPMESRRDDNVTRVRSFSAEQLSNDTRYKRWDRVRVVCSQPYNRHCKYGLSFIHIFEEETKDMTDVPVLLSVPKHMLPLDTMSSDEEDFRPGELFAKHLQNPAGDTASTSTDAQIRKATSHALKNIPDSSTKLTKTPIDKTNKQPNTTDDDRGANRKRTSLMYTDDDEQPHAKIDRVVNRHNDEKDKQGKKDESKRDDKRHETKKDESKRDDKRSETKKDESKRDDKRSETKKDESKRDDKRHETKKDESKQRRDDSSKDEAKTPQLKRDGAGGSRDKDKDNINRQHSDEKTSKRTGIRPGPVTDSPGTLMSDVVFVLSGYENPRRAAVRDAALCMGASMQRDWGPTCTHLICAFPNTPKLKAVRASPQAKTAVIVTAEWVERCCETRRRLPWQWFATEPARRVPYTDRDLKDDADGGKRRPVIESDSDEDRPQRNIKKRRTESPEHKPRGDTKQRRHSNRSPSPRRRTSSANISTDSDVAFVRDERIKGNVTIADSDSDDTDKETSIDARCAVDDAATLPDFFDGFTFAIDSGVEATFDSSLLGRYVRAYGGVLVEASQIDEDTGVDYLLCARAGSAADVKGKAVRADWVWRCHEEKQRLPITDYAVS